MTEVHHLEYDVTFTGGLVQYNDGGDRQNFSVTTEVEVRTVDNAGAATSVAAMSGVTATLTEVVYGDLMKMSVDPVILSIKPDFRIPLITPA